MSVEAGALFEIVGPDDCPMLRTISTLCLLGPLGLLGCHTDGAETTTPETLSLGDPDGEPRLKVLPSLARDASGRTHRTRHGILVAREGFKARMPATPDDTSYGALQQWVDKDVIAWVGVRNETLDSARYEFGLPKDASPGERIVAMAVIGLLQEDTARELSTIPAPSELDEEPEIAKIYREVIEAHARPFLSSALVRYRECANIAHDGPEDMRHWAGFCDARFQRIKLKLDTYQHSISGDAPATAQKEPDADGNTEGTVTVIVESE